MFHLAACRRSLAASTAQEIYAVSDDVLTVRDNRFFFGESLDLLFAHFGSADLQRVRIQNPSLRATAQPQVRPVNGATLPTNPPKIANWVDFPIPIPRIEGMIFEGFQDNAGAQVVQGVVGVSRGLQSAPSGHVVCLRLTGTSTMVAGAWTSVALTPDEEIDTGEYHVVWADFVGATCIGGRFLFKGQTFRPGFVGYADVDQGRAVGFDVGRFGSWGKFDSYLFPECQFFCNAADTAQTVYLYLVKA